MIDQSHTKNLVSVSVRIGVRGFGRVLVLICSYRFFFLISFRSSIEEIVEATSRYS